RARSRLSGPHQAAKNPKLDRTRQCMDRIVDIATDGRHLSAHRGFLIVSERQEEGGRIPLDDGAAVIVHAHGITWSTNLIVALAERGGIVLLCGSNHAPVAVCLPLDG